MAAATLDEETSKKVIRQVEFYFSDSNLPRDAFMKKTISESEDGLVSLALLCSFTRMKNHLKLDDQTKPDDVSDDTVQAVSDVLRCSTALKISEDGKKVGRASELSKPDEVIEQSNNKTVAASPLEYDVKLEDVESFFGEHAKVSSVRLPRHVKDKRIFCGTALVEFETVEEAKKVLSFHLVYSGAKLELRPKKEFDEERETQTCELDDFKSRAGSKQENGSGDCDSYPRGLILAFSLRSMSSDHCEKNGVKEAEDGKADASVPEGKIITSTKDSNDASKCADDENAENNDTCKESGKAEVKDQAGMEDQTQNGKKKVAGDGKLGSSLHKDNMDVVMWEDLKAVFKKFGTVKYVDFSIGATSGYVRFEVPEASQKARAAAVLVEEGGLIVKNYIAVLEPVIGDTEREYWSRLRSNRESSYNNNGKRARDGKFFNGGKKFNKKRGRHN